MLPVPAGARPYRANANRPLSLKAFVQQFYMKTVWADEEGRDARRGFKTGEVEGWINTDGSEQIISIARFKTAQGARSMYEGMTAGYTDHPKPATLLNDAAVGGLGWVNPTLDSYGNARVEIAALVRDEVVIVVEYTAATPDTAAAKALMLKQYDKPATRYGHAVARALNSAGSLCTGMTRRRWPPGARSTWHSSHWATCTAPRESGARFPPPERRRFRCRGGSAVRHRSPG